MEIALAKMELDEAIADQKELSSFTIAIEQMEKLGLGTFSNLYNGFMKMITDARRLTTNKTSIPSTTTTPPAVADVIEEIEEEAKSLPDKEREKLFTPLGAESLDLGKTGGLVGTSSANNTIITVNTGALLGSEADVQVAVLKAIREAEKKGIKVIT